MMTFPVTLRLSETDLVSGPSDLWLIPGDSPRIWIDEICSWPVDQTKLDLFILPDPHSPVTPAGLFVSASEAIPQNAVQRAVPCKRVIERLAIPSGTRLRYPITKEDERLLVPYDLALLHPSIGLIAFDKSDSIRLQDLLRTPTFSDQDWSLAHPGAIPSPGLLGISVTLPPDPEIMLQAGQDDIGTENPDKLPKRPGENSIGKGLLGAAMLPGAVFFKGIQAFTNLFPEGAGSPTWLNHLEDWADRQLSNLGASQNKEIARLLDLLKNDPEQGLKFALPINNNGPQSRGVSPPGGRLGRRKINFNLGDVFKGGGAVDSWMLDPNDYTQLTAAYREAANREIQIGRFRRAAYIFATLLGDFGSAANALEQGRLFREAAVLYEKKLHDHESAARCFRKGGLLDEAIRLYEESGDFEELGKLYAKLNRRKDSDTAFEKAITGFLNEDHPTQAARLAREQFDDDNRALEIYHDAWPGSTEAADCLRKEFKLLQDLERHAAVSRRIVSLRDSRLSPLKTSLICERLIALSLTYPAEEVNRLASDSVRVVVARQLRGERIPALDSLGKLPKIKPNDLLLQRDAQRFSESIGKPKKLASPGPSADDDVKLSQESKKALPDGFKCIEAVAGPNGIGCMGVANDKTLRFVFADFGEKQQARYYHSQDWPQTSVPWQTTNLFFGKYRDRTNTSRFMLLDNHPGIETKSFSTLAQEKCTIQKMENADGSILAACIAEDSGLLVKLSHQQGELYLRWFKGDKELVRTEHLEMVPSEVIDLMFCNVKMISTNEQVFFSVQNHLACFFKGGTKWLELPSPIIDIAVTRPHTLLRLAVGMEHGGALVLGGKHWPDCEFFGEDMSGTRVAFTKSGHLIAASTRWLECYQVKKGELIEQYSEQINGICPVAIIPGINLKGFHIVRERELLTFKLEKKP